MNMTSVLKKIISYIVYVAEPEKIILFGSYAYGRNDVYSDIDLLIITCLLKTTKFIKNCKKNYVYIYKDFAL